MSKGLEAYILFEKTIEKSGVEITFDLSKARATLMQSLDRLEKLEKTFDILKALLNRVLIFKFKEDIISDGKIYISKIDSSNITIINLRKPEYELLKEVFENE